jgi:hypothetical protein
VTIATKAREQFTATKDSPADDFVAEASRHPVFKLITLRGETTRRPTPTSPEAILICDEDGLSSDPACAEPDNRCADTRTAKTVATPLVLSDLAAPISSGSAAGMTLSWCQVHPTIMKLCMRIRCPASVCIHARHYFRLEPSVCRGKDACAYRARAQIGSSRRPATTDKRGMIDYGVDNVAASSPPSG